MGKTYSSKPNRTGTGGASGSNGGAGGGNTNPRRQPKAQGHRAATRSSRAKLTNGLEDPAQLERELAAQLRSMGLYAANTMGDGNCLWRALSDQLYGTPGLHFTLRQEVCDHLDAYPERYAGFVDNDKSFNDYVATMRLNGTYGGHLELSAFAQLKQKIVKVVQPGLVYLVSGDDNGRERKEKDREIAQNNSEPGSEGPPPTEREQRRLRRAAKARSQSPVKQAVATKLAREAEEEQESGPSSIPAAVAATADQNQGDQGPIEAFGPLYIAYHNWEHYSSVRNLGGPHQGLPRIQVQMTPIATSESIANGFKNRSMRKLKGSAIDSEGDWVADDDPEPTEEENLVLQSCPGHDLQEVRQMMHLQGDWESVVEAFIAQDLGELSTGGGGATASGAAVGRPSRSGKHHHHHSSSHIRRNGTLHNQLIPPNPLPDHLRQYRATSPASVDTTGTRSSEASSSTSTTATTDDGPDSASASGSGAAPSPAADSRSASPMIIQPRNKRAASSDVMSASMTRSPKRRSRSRSPHDHGPGGGEEGFYADSDSDSRRASMDVQVVPPEDDDAEGGSRASSRAEDNATNATHRGTSHSSGPTNTSNPSRQSLPNKVSGPKQARQTARQKRDAEQQRKRERTQAKVASKLKGDNRGNENNNSSRAGTAEVKGFIELKI